jgi:hypothetical protein
MSSPNNSNRPVMKIKLSDNEALRAIVAAARVRMILGRR